MFTLKDYEGKAYDYEVYYKGVPIAYLKLLDGEALDQALARLIKGYPRGMTDIAQIVACQRLTSTAHKQPYV